MPNYPESNQDKQSKNPSANPYGSEQKNQKREEQSRNPKQQDSKWSENS